MSDTGTHTSSDEHDIIRRVLAGESRQYAILVERYAPRAAMLAERLLSSPEDAEEAVQDAFVRAYRALTTFEGRAAFSTWYYRILYNVCMTALKRRGRERVFAMADTDVDVPDAGDPLDTRLLDDELRIIVDTEIRRLPPKYSSILTMFLVNDQSYDDICRITRLPLGTVKNRLHRARALLRDAVQRQYSDSIISSR